VESQRDIPTDSQYVHHQYGGNRYGLENADVVEIEEEEEEEEEEELSEESPLYTTTTSSSSEDGTDSDEYENDINDQCNHDITETNQQQQQQQQHDHHRHAPSNLVNNTTTTTTKRNQPPPPPPPPPSSHLIKSINSTINKIGMGPYQSHLFLLCGFGWLSDNMWMQGIAVTLQSLQTEFEIPDSLSGLAISFAFMGMMTGASVWGPLSDIWGRKPAFTCTLLISFVCGCFASFGSTFAGLCWLLLGVGVGVTVVTK
jgi:hypothetical protein